MCVILNFTFYCREDYNECCESFIDEFCELEKNVNMSLLHLIVDIFKETTEPIERLIKTAMYSKDVSSIKTVYWYRFKLSDIDIRYRVHFKQTAMLKSG